MIWPAFGGLPGGKHQPASTFDGTLWLITNLRHLQLDPSPDLKADQDFMLGPSWMGSFLGLANPHTFQGFWDTQAVEVAQAGLKTGVKHIFGHPEGSRFTF